MQKMKYVNPEMFCVVLTKADILSGSDVLINGEDLFGEFGK